MHRASSISFVCLMLFDGMPFNLNMYCWPNFRGQNIYIVIVHIARVEKLNLQYLLSYIYGRYPSPRLERHHCSSTHHI